MHGNTWIQAAEKRGSLDDEHVEWIIETPGQASTQCNNVCIINAIDALKVRGEKCARHIAVHMVYSIFSYLSLFFLLAFVFDFGFGFVLYCLH